MKAKTLRMASKWKAYQDYFNAAEAIAHYNYKNRRELNAIDTAAIDGRAPLTIEMHKHISEIMACGDPCPAFISDIREFMDEYENGSK